ncbi:hypothetical protein BVRB_7g168710 [Beta vulgaris subsp. vulgaris]|nr:hypothetical protein BVRB_7g168710 [Beta vulgaris subsp. vulgaris]
MCILLQAGILEVCHLLWPSQLFANTRYSGSLGNLEVAHLLRNCSGECCSHVLLSSR